MPTLVTILNHSLVFGDYPFSTPVPAFDFGFPILLFLLGLLFLYLALRHAAQRSFPRCPRCRYDMRAGTSLTCPECGFAATQAQLTARIVHRRWLWPAGVFLALPLAFALCFLFTYLHGSHLTRQAQEAKALTTHGCSFQTVPLVSPPPSQWEFDVVEFVDPNYLASADFSPLTCCILRLLHPVAACRSYFAFEEVFGVEMSHPTPERLRQAAEFPSLQLLRIFADFNGSDFKSQDFQPLASLSRLHIVELSAANLDPACAEPLFRSKPLLVHASLSFDLESTSADSCLNALALGSPDLVSLEVSAPVITDAGVLAVSKCVKLTHLSLTATERLGAHLAPLKLLARLSHLSIRLKNPDTLSSDLSTLGALKSLKWLSLTTPEHPVTVNLPNTTSPYDSLGALSNLQNLYLTAPSSSDADLAFLKSLTQLQGLTLESRSMEGSGLIALASNPSLNSLSLSTAPRLQDSYLQFLTTLPALTRLQIEGAPNLTGAFLAHLPPTHIDIYISNSSLSTLPISSQVDVLSLRDCPNITDTSLKQIAGHPTLTHLHLEKTKVTNASCAMIAQLPKLEQVTLDTITLDGLQTLLTSKTIKTIYCAGVDVNAKAQLSKLHPSVSIY